MCVRHQSSPSNDTNDLPLTAVPNTVQRTIQQVSDDDDDDITDVQ